MSISTFNPRNLVLLVMILVVAALRIASFSGIGPLTLFTPVGAMALFGGACFSGKVKPFLLPLLTLFISDIVVSFTIFPELRSGLLYSGWIWTYLAFGLMVLAGKMIIRKVTVKNILLAMIVATVIHWLVSDIGVCVMENKLTWGFYLQRLITAIPFELRFLQGTAVFSLILFGSFELLQRKYPALHISPSVN